MTFLKNRLKTAATVVITVLVAGIAHTHTTSAQQSYPITCRGGGNLIIANHGRNEVRITFSPGRGPENEGLAPGQCTWPDRALSAGEPTTICDLASNAVLYVSKLIQDDMMVALDVYNEGRGCMRVTPLGPGRHY